MNRHANQTDIETAHDSATPFRRFEHDGLLQSPLAPPWRHFFRCRRNRRAGGQAGYRDLRRVRPYRRSRRAGRTAGRRVPHAAPVGGGHPRGQPSHRRGGSRNEHGDGTGRGRCRKLAADTRRIAVRYTRAGRRRDGDREPDRRVAGGALTREPRVGGDFADRPANAPARAERRDRGRARATSARASPSSRPR